jgi:hypothetical protein
MKTETERRRHRRAVNRLGRLVFTALAPLTLLFAAYSSQANGGRGEGDIFNPQGSGAA